MHRRHPTRARPGGWKPFNLFSAWRRGKNASALPRERNPGPYRRVRKEDGEKQATSRLSPSTSACGADLASPRMGARAASAVIRQAQQGAASWRSKHVSRRSGEWVPASDCGGVSRIRKSARMEHLDDSPGRHIYVMAKRFNFRGGRPRASLSTGPDRRGPVLSAPKRSLARRMVLNGCCGESLLRRRGHEAPRPWKRCNSTGERLELGRLSERTWRS